MCGCDLMAACITYRLMFTFIDVREIFIFVLLCGSKNLDCFCAAVSTCHFLTSFINTGSFFCNFSVIPIMILGLLQFAFGANSAVVVLVLIFPLAEIMVTGILDTDFAVILGNFISGIGFLAAFCADFVFFMRVIGFYLCFVIMITLVGYRGAAGVIGCTEIEIADLTLADHDGSSVIAGSAGITLNGVEIVSFSVVNKAYMRKTLFEEKITFLRGITLTVFIRKAKIAGICNAGSL